MKPIIVVSHERSGTHFCINSIALNFGLSGNVINMAGSSIPDPSIEPEIIRKSHQQSVCFGSDIDRLLDENKVIYVIRDCRAVMVSCFHLFNAYPDSFPATKSMEEFLILNPSIFESGNGTTVIKPSSMVNRWMAHIDTWALFFSRICVVTYEGLSLDFESEVKKISDFTGLNPATENPIKPNLWSGSVFPRVGTIDSWKTDMTPDQSDKISKLTDRHSKWMQKP